MHLRTVEMQFNDQNTFAARSSDAYETWLWDIMIARSVCRVLGLTIAKEHDHEKVA